MSDQPNDLDKLLSTFGVDSSALQRIRFGGVVGKLAIVAVAVCAVLIVIASRTSDPKILQLCVGAVVLVAIIAFAVIGIHGHKHPVEATLEGGEIVALQHIQQEYAVKGTPKISSGPPVLEGMGQRPAERTSLEEHDTPELRLGTSGDGN